jgi:hypothetical protein
MALYGHADMVRAIARTCRVKLMSGFAGGQDKNTLSQALASRWVRVPPTCLWLLSAAV